MMKNNRNKNNGSFKFIYKIFKIANFIKEQREI